MKNVFTFKADQDEGNLLRILNANSYVTVVEAPEVMFRDWDVKAKGLYSKISDIKENHVFRVNRTWSDTGICMEKREFAESGPVHQRLAGRNSLPKFGIELRAVMLRQPAKQLVAPGLTLIKLVDFYEKWRPLLPGPLQCHLCGEVTQEQRDTIRAERNEKAAGKRKNKNESKAASRSRRSC